MELTPELIALGGFVILGALVVVLIWPSVGFALLFSIAFFKLYLRSIVPALMESFTYNMAVASLALVGALVYRLRKGYGMRINLPGGMMLCWLVIGALIWIRLPATRDFEEGWRKALIFSIFDTLACLAVVLYACTLEEIRRLLRVLLCLGVFATLAMLFWGEAMQHYRGARQTFFGAYVSDVANACVNTVLILLGIWLARRKSWQLTVLALSTPVFVYTIVASGTRGAVVAAPLAIFALLWSYRRSANIKLLAGLPAAVIVVVFLLGKIISPDMLMRFEGREFEKGWEDRTYMARVTWAGFLSNPILGNGPGDSAYQLSGTVNSRMYPHNPVLEIFNELGVGGGLAYLGLMFYALRAGWRLGRWELEKTEAKALGIQVFGCFVYTVVVGMKGNMYAVAGHTYFLLILTVLAERFSQGSAVLATQAEPCADELQQVFVPSMARQ